MLSTDEPRPPSTIVLTPASSTQSLTSHLGQDTMARNTPPLFTFEARAEQAVKTFTPPLFTFESKNEQAAETDSPPLFTFEGKTEQATETFNMPLFTFESRAKRAAEIFTPRYSNSFGSTDVEGHDDSGVPSSSHIRVFSSSTGSSQSFLSRPPDDFAYSCSRETSPSPIRPIKRPGSVNRHRAHRPSYSFRNLHNATPEPPEREDQYPQVSNVKDSSHEIPSTQITSFPAEREDAYLQLVSDHLPVFHTSNEAISSSEIDNSILRQTSSLAIEDPLPHGVNGIDQSSIPANSIIHQAQELPVESVTKYAQYDPKDEAAPRTLYFSRSFQDDIKSGRDICGRIANTLETCELAQDSQSQIHGLLLMARQLENFQSPVKVTVGVIGDSGAGKSSLINSLLHEDRLAKAMSFNGSACTNTITEYHQKRSHDFARYTFEVDCMTLEEIDIEIDKLLDFFRRVHTNHTSLPAESIPTADELKEWENMAAVAWSTFHAVFGHREELSEEFLKKDPDSGPSVRSTLQQWLKELQWPLSLRSQGHSWKYESPDGRTEMEEAIGIFWPFVRVIRVYLSSQILKTGVVLVDLPGFNDTNAARVHVAEQYMFSCDELFVVTKSDRSITNTSVEEIVAKCVGQKLELLKPSQRVSIVCSHLEDASQKEAEVLYKTLKPGLDKEGYERLQVLKDLIKKAKRGRKPYGALEAESKQIVMNAHGQIIKKGLLARYGDHPTRETPPNVFCVANRLYEEYMGIEPEDSDEFEAMNIAIQSSGIPELRKYSHGVPAQRQLDIAKHFLNVSIEGLLNKVKLWLADGAENIGADKIRESLKDISKNFQEGSAAGIQQYRLALVSSANSTLMHIMSNMKTEWTNTAANSVLTWRNELHHSSWRAVIRRKGVSNRDPINVVEWNLRLLKDMEADTRSARFRFRENSTNSSTYNNVNLEAQIDILKAQTHETLNSAQLNCSIDCIYRDISHYWDAERQNFVNQLEEIYHNLTTNRESSYVRKYMNPVYQACRDDEGDDVCLRDVSRLQAAIQTPGLFTHLQRELKKHLRKAIYDTSDELLRVLNVYHQTITADFELLQGNEAMVVVDAEFLDALRLVLGEAEGQVERIAEQIRDMDQTAGQAGDQDITA